MMYKNSILLAIGAALLLSLFFVDGSYAFQIVNRKPPVDFLTVAQMNGWTEGPLQIVGALFGAGLIVLIGLGIRRFRHHHHHSYQA
jgi:hypothetical protein